MNSKKEEELKSRVWAGEYDLYFSELKYFLFITIY